MGAHIAPTAIAHPGVELGAGSLVGAGSVIAHDVAPGMIVHGRVEPVTRAIEGAAR